MASTVTELLRRRLGGKPLPYDAEVEYLQCDGTQYIDTNVLGNLNTKMEMSFRQSQNNVYAAGSRGDNTDSITFYIGSSATQRFGDKFATKTFSTNTDYVLTIDNTGLTMNGAKTTFSATTSFTTQGYIYIMWASANGTPGNKFKGEVYYFKLWSNDELVRDMIPVRVGTTGYMYDKVSGQLFGNAGTGDFILGNDI